MKPSIASDSSVMMTSEMEMDWVGVTALKDTSAARSLSTR